VPVHWRLYDSCRRWLAFADVSGQPTRERIVLMDTSSGVTRTVLERPLTRRPALAVTDVRVSDGWVAWEETSPYDIDMGPTAEWRIWVAPIEPGPRLGRTRLVDRGTVGSRPRCIFSFDGDALVYGLTEAMGREPVTGRVLAARTGLVRFCAATAGSSIIATFPGAIDAFASAGEGRGFIVVRREGPALESVHVTTLDGAGRRAGLDALLPRGTATAGYPAADPRWTAMSVADAAGQDEPRLCVADGKLQPRWTGPSGSQDPVVVGGRILYRIAPRVAAGRSPLASSLVMLDPKTGAQQVIASSVVSRDGSWVLPSGGRDPRHAWAMLDRSAEAIEAGRTSAVVRRYDLP
jgi:hypothetical protein